MVNLPSGSYRDEPMNHILENFNGSLLDTTTDVIAQGSHRLVHGSSDVAQGGSVLGIP